MAVVYFSLGSNEGNRLDSLVKATQLIDNLIGKVMKYSSVVESEPWGFISESTFYNMVLQVNTELAPHQILSKALDIEASIGRIRHGNVYTNRIIDIDILFYDADEIDDENLVIPHPLMHKRKFVLQPLAEIAPDLMHPVFNASIPELLFQLNETNPISIVVANEEFARLINTINQS